VIELDGEWGAIYIPDAISLDKELKSVTLKTATPCGLKFRNFFTHWVKLIKLTNSLLTII